MVEGSAPLARLTTGIAGLDRLLGGGLPSHGVYLVEGPPGAGKTILANQLCYHNAEHGLQAIYLTLLAESHSRMLAHLRGLRFFRAELVADRVHYASGFTILERDGLPGLLRMTREALTTHGAALLVIDGLISAIESAETQRDIKKFVHELQTLAGMTRCTVLLLASAERSQHARPEHTMVDGIIELSDEVSDLRSQRHLEIRKLRGSASVRGRHTLSISSDGIAVRPRIEAELLRLPHDAPVTSSTERLSFGISGLDRMLDGGLPASSTTMIFGPSGAGKTILGLQFLTSGAKRGAPGLYFGFYERPAALLAKGDRLGMSSSSLEAEGLLKVLWEPYGESDVDSLGDRLLRVTRELRPERLFLDGLHGFEQSLGAPERLGSAFSAIAEKMEASGATLLYSVESNDIFGPSVQSPIRGLSAITHNILLLRYTEVNARLLRAIAVLKLRDSRHDATIHEMRVSENGIAVLDTFNAAQGVLSGLATRAKGPLTPPPFAPAREVEAKRETHLAQKANILIIDDEFGLADLMGEILGERGYRTTIAINGDLGLRALAENRPDLVLLDLMMPVLSGAEMLERMKDNPRHAAIPVVLMTAVPEAVTEATARLCETILQKPFGPDKLFEVVEGILSA